MKEEQKKLIIDMMKSDEELGLYDESKKETDMIDPKHHIEFINNNIDVFDESIKKIKNK